MSIITPRNAHIWLIGVLLVVGMVILGYTRSRASQGVPMCTTGVIGFPAVTELDGNPRFWLTKKTGDIIEYEDVLCFLPGNIKVMVLGDEKGM